jgi:hypothetical protein
MFGKKFKDYVEFERWILILIAVVFVARLAISLAGAPMTTTRWVSVNIVLLIGMLFCAVTVHTRGFGGYKQLFGLLWIQTYFAHVLIASGIVLGILTGMENAYTAPEVSGGGDGKTLFHAMLHLLVGAVIPVFPWLIGSVILFVTKKASPQTSR